MYVRNKNLGEEDLQRGDRFFLFLFFFFAARINVSRIYCHPFSANNDARLRLYQRNLSVGIEKLGTDSKRAENVCR